MGNVPSSNNNNGSVQTSGGSRKASHLKHWRQEQAEIKKKKANKKRNAKRSGRKKQNSNGSASTAASTTVSEDHSISADTISVVSVESHARQPSVGTIETLPNEGNVITFENRELPLPDDTPPALALIRDWARMVDELDMEGLHRILEDSCVVTFIDAELDMLLSEIMGTVGDMYASFPDLKFYWKSVRLVPAEEAKSMLMPSSSPSASVSSSFSTSSAEEKNQESDESDEEDISIVIVEDYHGAGTHTGAPFAFGPFPGIPATGTSVVDVPQDVIFEVNNKTGTIRSLSTDSFGKLSGPANYYTQVGGLII